MKPIIKAKASNNCFFISIWNLMICYLRTNLDLQLDNLR